jgi:sugar/nucleoside kinase (ribokinase family)
MILSPNDSVKKETPNMDKKHTPSLHIAGLGCCLMDYLHTHVNFADPAFQKVLSQAPGDGGLKPGALVFADDFEAFAGMPFQTWLNAMTGGAAPDAENLGGPAIVALIHAAQMLSNPDVHVSFHGGHGDDEAKSQMLDIIGKTPVDASACRQVPGATPRTVVLSDPAHGDGGGERTFINTIGAAAAYTPDMVGEDFYQADIRLFGATALVPTLHDHLADLLRKGREHGGVNVVGTVYDFRNERRTPERPWPLGDSLSSFPLIDLLVCDREEALRISDQTSTPDAIAYFLDKGVSSVVVTHGTQPIHAASRGGIFAPLPLARLPVSQAVDEKLSTFDQAPGDTTGCGDNFLGGVLYSLAAQMLVGTAGNLDLGEACSWGAVSGGYACFYPGGTFIETRPGQKRDAIEPYYRKYREQISV